MPRWNSVAEAREAFMTKIAKDLNKRIGLHVGREKRALYGGGEEILKPLLQANVRDEVSQICWMQESELADLSDRLVPRGYLTEDQLQRLLG